MKYRLTIFSGAPEEGEAGLSRHVPDARLVLDALPREIPQAALRLEEAADARHVRVRISSSGGAVVCGGTRLEPGEAGDVPLGRPVVGDGWWLVVHAERAKARVAFSAEAAAHLAALLLVVAFLGQLFLFTAFPALCRRGDFWRRQREVQELFAQADAVQRRLEDFHTKDPVTDAYVAALGAELRERRDFLRENALRLKPSERRRMLQNVRRTADLVERLEAAGEEGLLPPLPDLSIEEPVRAIIEERDSE